MDLLPREIIQSHDRADAVVIWLHGLGADGHDFAPIVPELHLPSDLNIRFVFPHAPMQPVTINGGYVMRAWYDIKAPNLQAEEDEQGIIQSQQHIVRLIEHEISQGIAANKIVLAGFSQGGAISLYTGLRYPQALAGVMALSTYLPLAQSTAAQASSENRTIPIMMVHGEHDPIVPLQAANLSRAHLEDLGYKVQWSTYPMEHSVCQEEITAISEWLLKVLQ